MLTLAMEQNEKKNIGNGDDIDRGRWAIDM